MRLFFAVPLSGDVRAAIEEALADFPIKKPPWRWIKSANLHITLKFLGEVDDTVLDSLIESGKSAASRIAPFTLVYGPFGGFPSLSRPRVLFYSVTDGATELAGLARVIEEEVASLGFPEERRAFKAHVTLARVKRPIERVVRDKLKEVESLPPGTVQKVESFSLFRSHLKRDGAVYEELERFRLEGRLK